MRGPNSAPLSAAFGQTPAGVVAVGQGKLTAAAVKTQTRTHSGPPSTGAAIAMDGGVADIAYYRPLKDVTVKEQAVKKTFWTL